MRMHAWAMAMLLIAGGGAADDPKPVPKTETGPLPAPVPAPAPAPAQPVASAPVPQPGQVTHGGGGTGGAGRGGNQPRPDRGQNDAASAELKKLQANLNAANARLTALDEEKKKSEAQLHGQIEVLRGERDERQQTINMLTERRSFDSLTMIVGFSTVLLFIVVLLMVSIFAYGRLVKHEQLAALIKKFEEIESSDTGELASAIQTVSGRISALEELLKRTDSHPENMRDSEPEPPRDRPPAPLGSPKDQYRQWVMHKRQPSNLVYLTIKLDGGAQFGGPDTPVQLQDAGDNTQAAFVLFPDGGATGWVFPNPTLRYREAPMGRVFPSVSQALYESQRADIEPVQAERSADGRWLVRRP